jgi:hypothetical protein
MTTSENAYLPQPGYPAEPVPPLTSLPPHTPPPQAAGAPSHAPQAVPPFAAPYPPYSRYILVVYRLIHSTIRFLVPRCLRQLTIRGCTMSA